MYLSASHVLHFKSLDSTNEEALRQLAARAPTPLWIVAEEQTQGRGRSGRVWHSPRGNLYASLLLVLETSTATATQLSFVAALAVYDAISGLIPTTRRQSLRLKWPNDVLLDGAKAAGILLESLRAPDGKNLAVVLGIGINVSSAPPVQGRAVTSLGLEPPAVLEAFQALASSFEARFALWDNGAGFAAVRASWLERAFALNEAVSVNLNGKQIRGKFCGLDSGGALQLETRPGFIVTVTAGDVFPEKTG
jgi:BirA family transcriptional regulator, biotin operon repressor / biotin---[acetyl-CoA-carboxylase] ligase